MNKIFNIVYSVSRNALVVCSELAKGKKKATSRTSFFLHPNTPFKNKFKNLTKTLLALSMMVYLGSAQAYTDEEIEALIKGGANITLGGMGKSPVSNEIINDPTNTGGNWAADKSYDRAKTVLNTTFTGGSSAVAIGSGSIAMSCRQAMVAMYTLGKAGPSNRIPDILILANGIAKSRGIDADAELKAFGKNASHANFFSLYNKLGMNGVIHPSIHSFSYATNAVPGLEGVVLGGSTVYGNTAIGTGAVASGGFHGIGGTAIGHESSAMGGQSVALGHLAHAYSDQATAIGSDSYATGFGSVVLGGDDLVGDFHLPNGKVINVGGYRDKLSVSRILSAYVYGNSIKIDNNLLQSKSGETKEEWFERLVDGAHYDKNQGYKVVTRDGKDLEEYLNENNVTFLKNRTYKNFKQYYLNEKTGRRQYSPSFAAGTGAIALGSRAMAAKKGATALGPLAFALGKESTAMGVRTYVDNDADGGIAMGIGSHVFAENGLAVGNHSESTQKYSAAFGNLSRAVGEGSLALGDSSSANGMLKEANKEKFLEALKKNYANEMKMSGNRTPTQSIDSILGKDYEFEYQGSGDVYLTIQDDETGKFHDVEATKQKGDYATAIGHLVLTDADRAVALGNTTYVGGDRSIGIGATSMVSEKADDSVGIGTGVMLDGVNSVGIGTGANVSDANAMAIGYHTKASAANAQAIGNEAIATGVNSVGIGTGANVSDANAMAIGYHTKASAANAQAIGNEAQASLANSTALGVGSRTDYTVEDLAKPGYIPAGSFSMPSNENVGLISVGSIGNERRITNLASGYRDTDAVNVAQLKALANRINYGDDEGDKNAIRYVSTYVSDDVKQILTKEGSYKKVLALEEQRLRVEAVKATGAKINEDALNKLKQEIQKEKAKLNVDSLSEEAKAKIREIENLQFTSSQSQEEMNTAIATAKANAEDLIANDGIYTEADKTILTTSNVRNDGATGEGSIAIGKNAKAEAKKSIVIGENATAIARRKGAGTSSIVIGEGAKASFHEDDRSTAGESIVIGKNAAAGSYKKDGHIHDAIAIGTDSKGYGHRAVAIGKEAHIGYSDDIAIGTDVYVMGAGSTAIGQNASVEKKVKEGEKRSQLEVREGLALGKDAHVHQDGGVALGANSVANRAGFTESTLGKYSNVDLKGITLGAVSVGGNGKLRQIINVGDATEATDAVNLRQLDAAITNVSSPENYFHVNTGASQPQGDPNTNLGSIDSKSGAQGVHSLTAGMNAFAGAEKAEGDYQYAYASVDKTFLEKPAFIKEFNEDLYVLLEGEKDFKPYKDLSEENKGKIESTYIRQDTAFQKSDGTFVHPTGAYAMAIGYAARAVNDQASAIGFEANAIGARSAALGNQTTAIGQDSIAVGMNTLTVGDYAMAVGRSSVATESAKNSLVIGNESIVRGAKSLAIGNQAYAGKKAVAYIAVPSEDMSESELDQMLPNEGLFVKVNNEFVAYDKDNPSHQTLKKYAQVNNNETSDGNFTMAIGYGAEALTDGSAALGFETTALGKESAAIGYGATSTGTQSIALGVDALSGGETSIAIGNMSGTAKDATSSVAMGNSSLAKGVKSMALGFDSEAVGEQATAVGASAEAVGTSAIAFGDTAKAKAEGSVSIGASTNANGKQAMDNGTFSTAIGARAQSEGASSLAMGVDAKSKGDAALALGQLSEAKANNTVALGNTAVADGGESISIGYKAKSATGGAVALGSEANSSFWHSVAIGTKATATNSGAIAEGQNAKAAGAYSVAIGGGNTADEAAQASQNYGVALGWKAKATGSQATAMANGANATGNNSLAIGTNANAGGTSNEINTTAIGVGAQASHKDAIALGSWSETKEAKKVSSATVGGVTYSEFAGAEPESVVSVGKAGMERQILNVAAGEISSTSTDAINGSQLYAVANKIKTYTGEGNITIDSDNVVKTKDAVQFATSVTVGDDKKQNVKIEKDSIQFKKEIGAPGGLGNPSYEDGLKISSEGIDMADTEIKNLKSVIEGKAGADYLAKLDAAKKDTKTAKNAVNVSDLQQTASKLTENITKNATDITNLGDRVTTNEGNITKVTNKVDALNDWRLVADASGSYKVSNDGKVTLQVKDANGKDSTVKNVVIEGIAKSDLGNITNEGNTVIKNLAKDAVQLANGNKTTVTSETKDGNKIWHVNVTEGNIAAADEGLVSGKKVFNETRVTKDNYNYINKSNTAAANLEALDTAIKGTETTLVDKGLKFGANSGNENPVTNKLGSTVKVVGSGKEVDGKYDSSNIKTRVKKTGDDTEIEVMLSKELALDKVVVGEKGKDGAPGKPGSIGINGKDGKSAEITIAKGQDGVDGKHGEDGITRIVYDNHEVATMEDGLKFQGDSGDVVKKKLNETLSITGGEKVATNLTENNIGITNDEQKGLVVKLAKDIDLGNEGSLTIAGNKYIGKDGINAGSKVITNVKSSIAEEAGAKYSDKLANANTNNPNNAVNVSDLHGVADEINKNIATQTFGLTADGKKATRTLGNEIGVLGDDNLTVAIDGAKEGAANLKLSVNKGKLVENIYKDTTLVEKIEGATKISYTANSGDPKQTVSLKDGFNFKQVDDVTTVTAKANGEVTFGLDKKITDKIDGAIQTLTSDDKTVTLNPTTGSSIDLAVNIDNTTIKKVAKGQTNEGQLYVDAKGVADKIFNNDQVINNTTIDDSVYNKFESGMDLAYKANGANPQSVKLNKGLDFKNGTYTTATVDKDGVVIFDINSDKAAEFTAKSREVVKANPETNGYITVTPEGTGPDNLIYKVGFDKSKLEGEFDAKYIQQWTAKVNGNETAVIGNDGTVDFVDGTNILVTKDGSAANAGEIKIATSMTPTFTTVKAGNTLMNTDGITITGGPTFTKTNINMGGQQIHNVKKGTTDDDAVNVKQLTDAINNINVEVGDVISKVDTNQAVMYTCEEGNIVIPIAQDDGTLKYYKKSDLEAGKPKPGAEVIDPSELETRVINPEHENSHAATILGNVGSSIDKHIKTHDSDPANAENKIIDESMNATEKAQAKVKYLANGNTTANPEAGHKVVNIDDLKDVAMAGLDFVGNDESNVHKNIGETVSILGEGVEKDDLANFKSASGNIAVVADSSKGLVVKLNQDLANINSISHKDGTKITLNGDSITLSGDKNATIQIKGVTAGTADTDAVNKKQLDDLTIAYKANNVANDKDGNKVEPVTLAKGLDFTNGAHTTAEIAANGVVKFNVKEGSISNEEAGNELVTGKTVFNEVRVPVKQKPDGSSAYNVIDSKNTAAKNIVALDTAVGNKLNKDAIHKIKGSGLAKVTQEDITVGDVTVNVDPLEVKKAAQESLAEGTNISLSKDKSTGVTTIATQATVKFDTVTVGDIVVDKNTGINAGNKEITNVKSAIKDIKLDPSIKSPTFQDKIIAANNNEDTKHSAVNVSDLYSTAVEISTNLKKKTFGVKVAGKDTEGKVKFDTATRVLDDQFEVKGDGNITVSIDGKDDPTKAALKLGVDKTKLVENIYKDETLVKKIEGATSIKYHANSKNEQTVSLAKGLDFTNGTHTTAEVAKDGVVKFNVKEGSISNEAAGNELVTGKSVFTEVRVPGTDSKGNAITYNALVAGNTTSQNLVALDKATKENKEAYAGIGVIKVAGDAGLQINNGGSLKGNDVTITLNKADVGNIAAAKFKDGTNITFTKDGTSGVTTIATASDVTFDKVTLGKVVLDKNTGINAGDLGIANVKSAIEGQLPGQTDKTFLDKLNAAQGDNKTAKNAVNVSDLQQTASKLTENITNVKNVADTALQDITSSDKTVKVDKQGTTVDLKVNIDGTTVVKNASTGVISVGKIGGENITNNSITGDHIANNTIKEGNIDNSLIQKLSEKTVLGKGTHTTLTGDGSKTNPYVVDVLTDGAIASENTGIVTGDTIFKEVRVPGTNDKGETVTYNAIAATNTTSQNLVALDDAIKNMGIDLAGKTFGVKVKNGTNPDGSDKFDTATRALDSQVEVKGDGNVIVSIDGTEAGKAALKVSLDDNINVGKAGKDGVDGVDGVIGVNGKDGKSSVAINGTDGISIKGKDGKDGVTIKGENGTNGTNGVIGLNGHDGVNGKDGKDAHADIMVANGQNGVDGTDGSNGKDGMTRIVYNDGNVIHEVATLDDGLKFVGDDGTVIAKKLNETLGIKGGVTADADITDEDAKLANLKGKLTDSNIGVVKGTDGLEVKLAKDLKGLDSVTVGNVVIDKTNGINAGNKGISNVKSVIAEQTGDDFIDKLDAAKLNSNLADNAVNVSDLWELADSLDKEIGTVIDGKTFGLKVTDSEGNVKEATRTLGNTVEVIDDGNVNVSIVGDDAGTNKFKVSLDDNINVGKAGKDGVDGVIGVNGKDGKSSVAINGTDGISIKGKDGKDGVTIKGENGTNGTNGVIGLNGHDGVNGKDGKDAHADIMVANGQNGVDGTDGNNGKDGMTRIVYNDGNVIHEVATLDDGLIFAGNDGKDVTRKLNSTLTIKGEGIDKAASGTFISAEGNINVEKDGDGGLEVQLNKNLTNLETATFNNTLVIGKQTPEFSNKDGLTGTKDDEGNYVTGLDNTDWKEDGTYVSGRAATEDQLKAVEDKIQHIDFDNLDIKGVVKYEKTNGEVNYGKITLEGKDGTTLSNVKSSIKDVTIAGKPEATYVEKLAEAADKHGTDAVNVSDLHQVSAELAGDIASNTDNISNLDKKLTNNYYDKTHIDGLALNYQVEQGEQKSVNLKDGVLKFVDDGNLVASYGENGEIKYGLSDDLLEKINNIHNNGDTVVTNEFIYYKANGGSTEKVKLTEGLNFSDGDYTKATIAENGKVTFDVDETKLSNKIEDVVNNHTVVDAGKVDLEAGNNITMERKVENIDGKDVITGITVNVDSDLKNMHSIANGKEGVGAKITLNAEQNVVNFNNGAEKDGNAKLTGIAAGEVSENSTDAINGSQLHHFKSDVNNMFQDLSTNLNKLNRNVDKMDKNLRAGVAGATAMSFLQMPHMAGKSLISAAVGGYKGEQAVGVGYSRISDNGKVTVKFGAAVNSRNDLNYGASVGFQW